MIVARVGRCSLALLTRAIVCLVTELCSDDDARLRVEAAQVIEGHGHLGQIGDREQLKVRREFRDLADGVAKLRRQRGRRLVDATRSPQYVSEQVSELPGAHAQACFVNPHRRVTRFQHLGVCAEMAIRSGPSLSQLVHSLLAG
jgi:hypothetical protein